MCLQFRVGIGWSVGSFHLAGQQDRDILYGDAGIDILDGSEGNDPLFGGADNNTVSGAKGDNILSGGSGKNNLFIFGPPFWRLEPRHGKVEEARRFDVASRCGKGG